MSEGPGLEQVRAGMPPLWSLMARSSGGSVWERDGITAAVVPRAPKRSVFNSVFYEDGGVLLGCLEELAQVYAEAGVLAWTVWVPEQDAEVASGLEQAGHSLDATPRAMAMRMEQLRLPGPDPELRLVRRDDQAELARINEVAYGWAPGDFSAVADSQLSDLFIYFAELEGKTVASAATWEHDGDAELAWVATLPEARGRGVSSRLVGHALDEARDRGAATSTLQATALGYPVYLRLGYSDVGTLQMWERRRAEGGEPSATVAP